MSDSYIDHIPSHEREKIRKKMRSPEAYEKLRERVKGPEDLADELKHNDIMAEAKMALESDPGLQEGLKKMIEKSMKEQGTENLLDASVTPDARQALEKGAFTLRISTHPSSHQDQLMILAEGTVQETIPLKIQEGDRFLSQALSYGGASTLS